MSDQEERQKAFCFCELAPLYALDALNSTERRWVEERIQECPELAAELAEYEAAVAAIPYSVPSVPMAADLKERLFLRLTGEAPPAMTTPEVPPPIVTAEALLRVRAADVIWEPYNVPGVQMARLHVDAAKREVSCLIRAGAGAQYPSHRHGGAEEIFMLSGELVMGSEVYGPGDYIRYEPDSIHPPAETPNGCMFLLRTSLDNEIIS